MPEFAENVFELAASSVDEWDDADDLGRRPCGEWQDLLRNLQVHLILIRGVQIPYRTFKSDGGVFASSEQENRRRATRRCSASSLRRGRASRRS